MTHILSSPTTIVIILNEIKWNVSLGLELILMFLCRIFTTVYENYASNQVVIFSTFPHTCRVENRSFSLSPVILSLNSRPKMCFAAFLLLLLQFRFWDSGFICDHGLIPSRKIEMFCDTKKSGVWQIRLAKSFLKPSQIIPWCEHAFRNRRKLVRETGRVCFQVSSRFKIVWTWQYI